MYIEKKQLNEVVKHKRKKLGESVIWKLESEIVKE